jgi:hypothetical protein
MGTLKTFLDSKSLTTKHVVIASRRVEAHDATSRENLVKRVAKRRNKDTATKKYAELSLAKPKLGRGVTAKQVEAALADKPVARKVRTKIFNAVNALLAKKGGPVEFKALFEGSAARAGKKPKEAAKK